MREMPESVAINVDGKLLNVERGVSILQVAQKNNIYIPTLCAHKDLTSFGGCRMCIVEVDGMRGFPTACTTPVENGMVIRTDTPQIKTERIEILRLLLSEHPSSCLICDEKDECRQYMGTIRKAGVTTGCRYCPKDGQCELQQVVEASGLNEINYPIRYRNLPVEKDDPFYDRDYNLCILCGRCVRICKEIRGANIIVFKERGRHTLIGPAYDRSHLDAGCEFCGECVSVCPTGALSEKANKWKGLFDREQNSTCAYCGIGCQMRLLIKEDEIIGSLPAEDPVVSNGQLCVKGRFCVTELVNNHRRLKKPYKAENGNKLEIFWGEAIELAAEKLSACSPELFGMLVSPNCCNEDLYVAQKFARVAMASNNVDTSARLFYGPGFNDYLNLMRMSVPLSDIRKASTIFCIGLDTRFGRSVVGVELRKAINRGAKLITVHPRHHNLAIIAEKWIQPVPGTEANLFKALASLTEKDRRGKLPPPSEGEIGNFFKELSEVAEMVKEASHPVILVGSHYLSCNDSPQILESIAKLARNINAGVLPLPAHNNLFGSILMGAYPEILPGGFSTGNRNKLNELRTLWGAEVPNFSPVWTADTLLSGFRMKVLYLIGEVPSRNPPPSDFVIFQNIYPPDSMFEADIVLPSTAFTETDGTFINGEGRIQRIRKAVHPRGEALPDWEIICRIAQKMGKSGFDFSSVFDIHEEISRLVNGFSDFDNPERKAGPLACEAELLSPQTRFSGVNNVDTEFPLLLVTSIVEHTYLGFPLSAWVEGLRPLFAEGIVDINPEDAERGKIVEGDEVVVTSPHFEKVLRARIMKAQPQGILDATVDQGESLGPNPTPVRIRKKDV